VVPGARAQPGQHHAAVPAAEGCAHRVPGFVPGPGTTPRCPAISSAFTKAIPPFEGWCSEQAAWGSCRGLGRGCVSLQLLGARLSSSVLLLATMSNQMLIKYNVHGKTGED